MCVMWQDRSSFDLMLFKGIMVVLENLISSNEVETVKKISSNIRELRYINRLDVQLEYLIYALKNDVSGEEDSFYLESKRARKRPIKKVPPIDKIYSAYCALINYIAWVNITQGDESCQDDKDIAFSTIASFKQLIENPGIWDIFVLKLMEMLEYYGHYSEVEEILKKYVDRNPKHINAYIYLCVHLHKHKADAKTFIHYAEILADLCPSDERVLLLVQKWGEIGKYLKKRLKILFKFLDYSSNRDRVLGWHLLSSHLHKAVSSQKPSSMKLVNSSWKLRHISWNYLHFKSSSICNERAEAVTYKVQALSVLEPDHEYIEEALKIIPSISREPLEQNEVSNPESENFLSLYDLDDNVKSREC